MAQLLRRTRRAIVFNTVAALGDGSRQTPLPGFTLITTPQELVRFVRARWADGALRVLYTPQANVREHFDDVANLVWTMRDVVFAVDEVWYFQSPGWSPPALGNMMLMGRIRGHTLLWTAQRAAKVDKTLTSVSTELYVGKLTERRDLDAIRDCVPAEALERVPALAQWRFIHVSDFGDWREI